MQNEGNNQQQQSETDSFRIDSLAFEKGDHGGHRSGMSFDIAADQHDGADLADRSAKTGDDAEIEFISQLS